MLIEIERKFLVRNENWKELDIENGSILSLQQNYLSIDKSRSVRVRTSESTFGGKRGFLTVKGETGGCSRTEYEYEIPHEEAQDMMKMCIHQTITKKRHPVKVGDHIWEIDVFEDDNEGLVIAEIELQSETEEFLLPHWAGLEVTDDPRYYNLCLLTNPFCNCNF